MYKHFRDKKISNKIKLGRVSSKLSDAELIEIQQSIINNVQRSKSYLKDAVIKSLQALNIDANEPEIKREIDYIMRKPSSSLSDLFRFAEKMVSRVGNKIS
jgi:hypothetical protein